MSKLSDDIKRLAVAECIKNGVENKEDIIGEIAMALNSIGNNTAAAYKAHATMGHGRYAFKRSVSNSWR